MVPTSFSVGDAGAQQKFELFSGMNDRRRYRQSRRLGLLLKPERLERDAEVATEQSIEHALERQATEYLGVLVDHNLLLHRHWQGAPEWDGTVAGVLGPRNNHLLDRIGAFSFQNIDPRHGLMPGAGEVEVAHTRRRGASRKALVHKPRAAEQFGIQAKPRGRRRVVDVDGTDMEIVLSPARGFVRRGQQLVPGRITTVAVQLAEILLADAERAVQAEHPREPSGAP